MGKEVERKFLVTNSDYRAGASCRTIRQGYLCFEPEHTVRVRLTEHNGIQQGFLTVKGKNKGICRAEFEYEIPPADAETMLTTLVDPNTLLEKTRWIIKHENKTWEVDEFHGRLEGLVIAEVELLSPDETITLPEWVGMEVSNDPRYYNSNLAQPRQTLS